MLQLEDVKVEARSGKISMEAKTFWQNELE